MNLTEKQAAGLLCPALTSTGDTRHCQTSFCMAWRWADPTSYPLFRQCIDSGAKTEPQRPSTVPQSWIFRPADDTGSSAHWREPVEEANDRRRGYCGLAGKPEGV